jgi:hypothetical protein
MNEHPIIFSGEMIRAILEGRKTQTRRIVKPQPGIGLFARSCFRGIDKPEPAFAMMEVGARDGKFLHYLNCPYGMPGGRPWVRETFAQMYVGDGCIYEEDFDNGQECKGCKGCTIEYRADHPEERRPGGWDGALDLEGPDAPHWHSPYHMHRWQSRLTLEIKSIRVERLQDISEVDARAEGACNREAYIAAGKFGHRDPNSSLITLPRTLFAGLWDSINAKRGFCWETNPWVWVIEFERITA